MSLARITLALCLAAAALAIAACGKTETASADPAAEQKAAAERARQGPYGTQLKALDQAKAMQADLNNKAREGVERAEKSAQ